MQTKFDYRLCQSQYPHTQKITDYFDQDCFAKTTQTKGLPANSKVTLRLNIKTALQCTLTLGRPDPDPKPFIQTADKYQGYTASVFLQEYCGRQRSVAYFSP